MAKLRGIARLLLKQSPCSIPRPREHSSEKLEGLKGKAIAAKGLKCTEPLYHRMIEKNSLSDKDSLEVLHGMSPYVYIDRHLNNIEMLTRAIRLNDNEDNGSSGDTVAKSDFRDKKLLTETLKKTVRKSAPKPRKNGSTSSVKVLKEMAVSLLTFTDMVNLASDFDNIQAPVSTKFSVDHNNGHNFELVCRLNSLLCVSVKCDNFD